MRHHSIGTEIRKGFIESNERLEFLGDSVLNIVVAEYLFNKFPFKDEGFLTEIRSKIVKRESLNKLAKKIGINEIIEHKSLFNKNSNSFKSIYGNALEALIGVVYLDKKYEFCKKFILKKLIIPHFDINELINTEFNFKGKIIEWSQKENKRLQLEVIELDSDEKFKKFEAQVIVNDKPIAKGFGLNKKRAEQDAAEKSCLKLKL